MLEIAANQHPEGSTCIISSFPAITRGSQIMSIPRRKFLQVGGIALLAAGAPLSALAAKASMFDGAKNSSTPVTGSMGSLNRMNKAAFAAHLNTVFLIRHSDAGEIPVRLVELRDTVPGSHRKLAARLGKECFSLSFRGPVQSLKQNTYRFRHNELGEFDMFIVPVKSGKHGDIYEAIFNHLDQ
jgi:hypothetical protein